MSQTLGTFAQPQNLGGVYGRWGYYKHVVDDTCNCSLEELTDVNIENLENGEYLCYDEGSGKWINCAPPIGPTEACADDESKEILQYRLADQYTLPGPITIFVPALIRRPFTIPIANWTSGLPGTGMNTYYVRGSAIATYTDLSHPDLASLWTNIGAINPIINTPSLDLIQENNSSPNIVLPVGECNKVTLHCITSPKLMGYILDDGNMGVLFRLASYVPNPGGRDPTMTGDYFYFQTPTGGGTNAFSSMWITEVGSHLSGPSSVIIDNQTASTQFRLEAIFYQGIRYGTTNDQLVGIPIGNSVPLFEIEPIFFLVKEKIILS